MICVSESLLVLHRRDHLCVHPSPTPKEHSHQCLGEISPASDTWNKANTMTLFMPLKYSAVFLTLLLKFIPAPIYLASDPPTLPLVLFSSESELSLSSPVRLPLASSDESAPRASYERGRRVAPWKAAPAARDLRTCPAKYQLESTS